MDGVENAWRTNEPSSHLDALTRGLGACCARWDFVARRTNGPFRAAPTESKGMVDGKGPRVVAALFHTLMELKRCVLAVEHLRYRGGCAGASEPVFFYIEKHHGIGDDSGGILLVAEMDLALDALPGGDIKVETFWKGIVSQFASFQVSWFSAIESIGTSRMS
jgi:hypothetical protein